MPESYAAILRAHLAAPDHLISATKLAEAAGYAGYEGANLRYSSQIGLNRTHPEQFAQRGKARASHGLLRNKFDIPLLRRDLKIRELLDHDPGVRIRCQPIISDLAFASPQGNYGLSDVFGHVSGSS